MRVENMRYFDATMAIGVILCIVAFIIFGNDDWTGAGIGLGMLAAALATVFIGAAT